MGVHKVKQLLVSPIMVAYFALAHAQVAAPTPASDRQVFIQRLTTISSNSGVRPIDCGMTSTRRPDASISHCGEQAFQEHKPFFLGYDYEDEEDFYGLAADAAGNIFEVLYDNRGYPAVAPDRHTRLLDDNQTRVAECIKPVSLEKTHRGLLACVPPVNREKSELAAKQQPVSTTICAILNEPAAFNNKVVRIHASYSGNFEYSELSDGRCGSIWFLYGGGGGPPGLAVYIPGGARPGAEDAEGRRILPVPVRLARDSNFEQFQSFLEATHKEDTEFQKLMDARDKADIDSQKRVDGFVSHCVSATFIGRIDAVSNEIHEFRKGRPPERSGDGLGFGQMGIFEAQFVMQSVDSPAMKPCREQ